MSQMIAVKFPYNAELVRRIRCIPQRRWDAQRRVWLIPRRYREAAERLLQLDQAPVAVPQPLHYHTEPRPYQAAAVQYGVGRDAVLYDMYMGLGKTKVALDILANRRHRRVLVICPKAVIPVWPVQIQSHLPAAAAYAVQPLTSGSAEVKARQARNLWPCTDHSIQIINYESVWRSAFGAWALEQPWDCIIFDECHRLAAPGSQQSLFCYRLGFAARQRIGLSGTPLRNSPMDAYGVYRTLAPWVFGTNYKQFQDEFAVMGGFNDHQVVGYKHEAEFQRRFNAIRFFVAKDELKLPEPHHITLPIPLPRTARQAYTELERAFYLEVAQGTVTADNALVKILRLMQITSGYVGLDSADDAKPIQELHTAKRDALQTLLLDLDVREPVVVFCRFRHDLREICSAATAAGRPYFEISGTHKEREAWHAAHTGAVLGVQIAAGSEGIDLTKAQYCVFYSISLSLTQFDQAHSRVWRPGQTRHVTYFHLMVPQSVDQKAYAALRQRREIIQAIVEGVEGAPSDA